MNPFIISGYKSPEYFCDRQAETLKIMDAIENSRNVTLVSFRRLGKTGLLRHVEHKIGSKMPFLYIDLYPTLELQDFINLFSNSIIHGLEPLTDRVIRKVTAFFSALRPRFSFDPQTGSPSIEINIADRGEANMTIHLLFDYIRQSGRKVTVAFDEFQQILEYPEKNVEALLRTEIQTNTESCFIFSGSQTHMLLSMFNEYSRPFYQSSEILELGKIKKDEYATFISEFFSRFNKDMSVAVAEYIYDINEGITFNVQYTCNKLFSSGIDKIEERDAIRMLDKILEENEIIYYNYRELLTKLQFQLMRAIAKEDKVEKPYSERFIQKYKLGAASSVRSAIEVLIGKGMLMEDQGLRVTDRFFSLWLKKQI